MQGQRYWTSQMSHLCDSRFDVHVFIEPNNALWDMGVDWDVNKHYVRMDNYVDKIFQKVLHLVHKLKMFPKIWHRYGL